MIKTFEAFNSDIDPYGEEDWGERDAPIYKYKNIINLLGIEIEDHYFDNGILYAIFFEMDGTEYCIDEIKSENGVRIWKTHNFLNRRKLVSNSTAKTWELELSLMKEIGILKMTGDVKNESINEIDPYGEEDWSDYIPKRGDKVRISKDEIIFDGNHPDRSFVITNKDILIYDRESEPYLKELGEYVFRCDRFPKYDLLLNRDEFEPIVNESFNEIDPYGEENWNDYHTIEEYLDLFKTLDYIKEPISIVRLSGLKVINFYVNYNGIWHFYLSEFPEKNTDTGNQSLYFQLFCDDTNKIEELIYCTEEELLDKTFKMIGVTESMNEIDPYGEENWDDDKYQGNQGMIQLWDALNDLGFITDKIFNEERGYIVFLVDYPKKGILKFIIEDVEGEGITLILIGENPHMGMKSIDLLEFTTRAFWDKLTFLVEGV